MIELDRIYNEDCLEGMARIPDGSVDCIICDLPYGTTACAWDSVIPMDLLWAQYRRIRKPGAAVVLFGNEPFSSMVRMSNRGEYRYDWKWDKVRGNNWQQANFAPMRNYEDIMVFCEYPAIYRGGGPTCPYHPQKTDTHIKHISATSTFVTKTLHSWNCKPMRTEHHGFYPKSIIQFPKDGKLHHTQKPVELIRYLVRTYTDEGATVLDNCMGSGTTAIACLKENRHYIGFELDAHYFEVAQKRIADELRERQETLF